MMRFTELPQVNSRILGKISRSSRLAMITRIGVDHRYLLIMSRFNTLYTGKAAADLAVKP